MNTGVSYSALAYALAALGNDSGGGGGGTGGTVSVKVDSTITGLPGTNAQVVNIGNEQEVLLQFTIPAGQPGLAGSQWFISNDAPGTSVEGAVNGDFILYSSGDVYTVQNGTPVATGINIVGEQGYSPSISVKVDTDTEYVLTVQNKDGSFDTPNLFADLSKISNLIIDGGEIGTQ